MRRPGQSEAERVVGRNYKVSDGLFRLLHIDLVAGRDFHAQDLQGNGRVVILNETAARRLFQQVDVVGREILRGDESYRVIGVVRDARLHSLIEPVEPFLFEPLTQPDPPAQLTLLARPRGPAQAALSTLVSLVFRMDPDLPVYQAQLLRDQIETLTANQRAAARLGAVLALLGVLLAGVGVYAALANRVIQRRRELAIRLAIGASPRQLITAVLRNGFLLATIGCLTGFAGASALSGSLQSLLWGIQRFDGLTYAAVFAFTTMLALLASALPARQVLQADPLESLRE
jgi:hypothetical protein